MANVVQDPPAVRSIHLQGGCRVDDVDNALQFQLSASNGRVARISGVPFHGAYRALSQLSMLVVGADYHFRVEQADGRELPDWRSQYVTAGSLWPCAEQADSWSFIAHAAIQAQNGTLWDVASRVSRQLRTCDWRLRQVSEAYRDLLHSCVRKAEFAPGRRFSDGFSRCSLVAISLAPCTVSPNPQRAEPIATV